MNYDVIIIGGGPAGLSAALYAGRSGLSVAVFEKMFAGGQVGTTYEVDNYLGFSNHISGSELAFAFEEHAKKFGAVYINEDVTAVDLANKKITTASKEYSAGALILAMGAVPRELGLEKEQQLRGNGVSYCATCDGAFFRGKDVAVVGGGDTALEDAIFLSRYCNKIYLIHRRDTFRGNQSLQKTISMLDNVQCVMEHTVEELLGSDHLEGLTLKHTKTGELLRATVSGLFVAVGTRPITNLVEDQLTLDGSYIVTDETMNVGLPGVYAAGDIRKKTLRQIVTAVSDGAIAAFHAALYLSEQ